MKRIFCFLPIFLFIATLQLVEGQQALIASLISQHLGGAAAGGDARLPALLVTAVLMLAALALAGRRPATRSRLEPLWWAGLLLMLVLGVVTLTLHDPALNKWKPSVLYWSMGMALWLSPLLFGKNLLKSLLGDRLMLPPKLWHRLNFAWVAFFAAMGLLNLWVAHAYSVDTWATFKLFGGVGLVLAFTVAQALVLDRCLQGAAPPGTSPESR
jgi:intracellular septation protein